MTEKSFYWADVNVGDGSLSTYSDDEFSDIWRILLQLDRTTMGYIQGYLNELVVTNPSGNVIRVDTGAALVDGKFYETDAVVNDTIATPAVSTRIDRFVLTKNWASQTVRVLTLTGLEGGGVPVLSQTDGVVWQIPLAQVSITTGAVITLTDERIICASPLTNLLGGAMREIETIDGDGATATIDFTGIADTWKHLMIIGTIRMDGAIVQADIELRMNADAGANYNDQNLRGDNATPAAAASAGDTEMKIGEAPAASATASHVGQIKILIPNYKETIFFKNAMAEFLSIPNNTVADFSIGFAGGMWLDTSAITQLTLISTTGSAGNFDVETKLTLYGIL